MAILYLRVALTIQFSLIRIYQMCVRENAASPTDRVSGVATLRHLSHDYGHCRDKLIFVPEGSLTPGRRAPARSPAGQVHLFSSSDLQKAPRGTDGRTVKRRHSNDHRGNIGKKRHCPHVDKCATNAAPAIFVERSRQAIKAAKHSRLVRWRRGSPAHRLVVTEHVCS